MTYICKLRVFRAFMLSALVASVGMALAGCGAAATTTTTEPAAPTASPKEASVVTIPTTEASTPVDIKVTNFTVSQNFEIRGQFAATNNGKTDVTDPVFGSIVVKRPNGEVLLETKVQGGVMDMKPMAGLPAGMTRPYSFSASVGNASSQLADGDEVIGTLTVRVDGHEQQVSLPSTKVTAVRIP